MAYIFYSSWILTEHLRFWNELSLQGCLWWYRADRDAAPVPPVAPAGGLARPAHGREPAFGRPPDAYFERLVTSVERVARHAFFPGKQEAVALCAEEVGDLIAAGRITADQGAFLLDILSGAPVSQFHCS